MPRRAGCGSAGRAASWPGSGWQRAPRPLALAGRGLGAAAAAPGPASDGWRRSHESASAMEVVPTGTVTFRATPSPVSTGAREPKPEAQPGSPICQH